MSASKPISLTPLLLGALLAIVLALVAGAVLTATVTSSSTLPNGASLQVVGDWRGFGVSETSGRVHVTAGGHEVVFTPVANSQDVAVAIDGVQLASVPSAAEEIVLESKSGQIQLVVDGARRRLD